MSDNHSHDHTHHHDHDHEHAHEHEHDQEQESDEENDSITYTDKNPLNHDEYELAAKWIKEADYLLIAAGAGMSVEAGNDYTDKVAFAKRFPGMVKHGLSMPYEIIGYKGWTKDLQWGYLLDFINLTRFNGLPKAEVYEKLLQIANLIKNNKKKNNSNDNNSSNNNDNNSNSNNDESSNVFVITSNVDGLFEQNGFDVGSIYTPQGDQQYVQCSKPCNRSVWPIKPIITATLPFIDRNTSYITDKTKVPVCPTCGGPISMNVNGGEWFITDHYADQQRKFGEFLNRSLKGKLVVMDIGAGFNTPTVIRFRSDSIAYRHPNAKLIRVNRDYPHIPKPLQQQVKAVGLRSNSLAAFNTILTRISDNNNANNNNDTTTATTATTATTNTTSTTATTTNANPTGN